MRYDNETIFLTKIQKHEILANNSFLFTTKEAKIRITFFSDEIVEIRIIKKEQQFDEFSYSVISLPETCEVNFLADKNSAEISTQKLRLNIDFKTSSIVTRDIDGTIISEDSLDFGVTWQGNVVTNYRQLKSEICNERFVGLGEKTGRQYLYQLEHRPIRL
jgi:alpha-glucosidase